ncbi:hypothetical protein TWF191_008077 [Orbilia oligospora]|uniref:Protein kinase domain-containing protein n=1 Tax=Orbilia oligospora TaxID=2813651 RepID=A0A7C8UPV9_ORBOL|nr:hypothetical protein TWF191_008077 [Orbilia oligospora]
MPSHIEKAAELLARPLPQVIQRDDNDPENTPTDDSIHPDHIFFWDGFVEDAKKTISETDLSQDVSLTDALEGECIIVGNRFALTGRFNANVGVPLAKASIATSGTREELKNLRFADAEVVPLFGRSGALDVVLVELRKEGEELKPLLKAVGEIKKFWTAKWFNGIRVSEGEKSLGREFLKNYVKEIGQLIKFMHCTNLRYGFISNYESTIFVKWTGARRFELTDPIGFQDAGPTVRQCFYHFGTLLVDDPGFEYTGRVVELRDVETSSNSFNLRIPPSRDSTNSPLAYSELALENEDQEEDDEGIENRRVGESRPSQRPTAGSMAATTVPTEDSGDIKHEEAELIEQAPSTSIGRSRAQSPREEETLDATAEQSSPVQESIVTAAAPADVSGKPRKISDITCRSVNGKKIFLAALEGQAVIAKYWPESLFKLYTRERNTYHHLPPSPYFPQMIACGDLILSHSLTGGYILVITQEEGIQLGYKMLEETPKAEKRRIRNALIEAVKVLRERDSMHGDPQPSNVLWDSETGKLKLLDFEIMWENYDEDPADKVEVLGILGNIDDGDSDDNAMDVGE